MKPNFILDNTFSIVVVLSTIEVNQGEHLCLHFNSFLPMANACSDR